MTDRKLLVLPVLQGVVTFDANGWITIDGANDSQNIQRENILGRQPEKGDVVIVLDIQDLADALRDGDDEMVETMLEGTVVRKTNKAIFVKRGEGDDIVSLPLKYLNAEVNDYVRDIRLPRWLAADRGL